MQLVEYRHATCRLALVSNGLLYDTTKRLTHLSISMLCDMVRVYLDCPILSPIYSSSKVFYCQCQPWTCYQTCYSVVLESITLYLYYIIPLTLCQVLFKIGLFAPQRVVIFLYLMYLLYHVFGTLSSTFLKIFSRVKVKTHLEKALS